MVREVKGDKGMENLYAFICPNCGKQLAATKEEAKEGKRRHATINEDFNNLFKEESNGIRTTKAKETADF